MNNNLKLSTILQQGAYNFGLDVQGFVAQKDAATRQYIDQKYALLAQEDTRVNGVIDNLLKIADAQPGTPEWDEGQNLYTLISNNYAGLVTRIEQNEGDINLLKDFATQTTQDISNWMTQVNGRIDQEIQRAQGEEQAIREELSQLKTDLEAKDELTDAAIATLNGKVGTLETKMTSRIQEIAALQTKQTEYGDRLSVLEGVFDALSLVPIVNEFRRGLQNQASAFGYELVPVA